MTLCYYITGHGYGHAVRSAQVLKALPPEVRVILKTTASEAVFREELPGRTLEVLRAEYDCGCLQKDSVTVLVPETLARYREIAAHNQENLQAEVAFLRREGVRCVVSDIASFPLRAASEAGIPGIAVSNFTWHDIYREYVADCDTDTMLLKMAAEYGCATEALITPLATPTVPALFPNVTDIPLIARRGVRRRDVLERRWPELQGRRVALLYVGLWGLPIDWAAVAKLDEWRFLTFEKIEAAASNVISIGHIPLSHADIAASVDLVVAKTGYGTVSECIADAIPLVYLPRHDFIEHAALVAGMESWGGGTEIGEEAFCSGQWRESLQIALAAPIRPDAYRTDGAKVAAERIMRVLQ